MDEENNFITNYNENKTIFSKSNKSNSKFKTSVLTFYDVLNYHIVKNNKEFIKIILFYFNEVIKTFGNIDKKLYDYLLKNTTFTVLHYIGHKGLHCHIDNIRDGYGLIVTIGLGSKFYYDLVLIFYEEEELNELNPIRISMKPNQITIMDGEMRICWQHCIPYGYKRKIDKYTLKFIFPKFRKNNPKYNNVFKQNFYTV